MWRAPPADMLSCTPTQRKSMVGQNPHLLFRRMDCLVVAIRKQDVSFIRSATNCDRAVHRHTGLLHRQHSNEGDEAEELNSSFPRQQERNKKCRYYWIPCAPCKKVLLRRRGGSRSAMWRLCPQSCSSIKRGNPMNPIDHIHSRQVQNSIWTVCRQIRNMKFARNLKGRTWRD